MPNLPSMGRFMNKRVSEGQGGDPLDPGFESVHPLFLGGVLLRRFSWSQSTPVCQTQLIQNQAMGGKATVEKNTTRTGWEPDY